MGGVTAARISKSYAVDGRSVSALKDVTLEMKDGEFVCVVGHSGCGKTTLLNILGGFIRPSSGQILIDGVSRGKIRRQHRCRLPGICFVSWRTALENISFGLEMSGLSKKKARPKAQHYLELVHLKDFADAYPHQLSGGMRQRVAVARALAYEPALLLMDEPFGALDAQTRERLQSLTQEIWQSTKKTFFYVTHNISEAVYLGERVVVMRPRPGHIHEIVPINLPRPRDPLSSEFIEIQRYITESLADQD